MKKIVVCVLISFLCVTAFILTSCAADEYGYGVDYDSTDYHTVTFDLRGGHINGYPRERIVSVSNGCTIHPDEFPEDPGFGNAVFGGWFTERNGIGNTFTKSSRVYSSFTVYAHWITK